MKKNLLKYLAVTFLVSLTGLSYAQQKCAPVPKEIYQDLNIATVVNNNEVTTQLLTKNCFDLEYYKKGEFTLPIYYSKNLETLRLYEATKIDLLNLREPGTRIDLISYFLLNPEYTYPIAPEEQELFKKWAQRYNVKLDTEDITFKVSPEERKKIIRYIASKYQGTTTTNRDALGNNNLFYAIQSGEYELIKPLLGLSYSTQNLYKKNSAGLTPVHMVFFMNYVQDSNKQQAIERTNDEVLKTLNTARILYLQYNNMSFYDFAELMKDKNPDFYEKLRRKFFFKAKIDIGKNQQLRENLIKSADSITLLKSMSNDPGK